MDPCLPADDPTPEARAEALEADRARYRFDRSIGGLPLAAEVPKGDGYSPSYMLRAVGVEATLAAGRALAGVDPRLAGARKAWDATLDATGGVVATVAAWVDDAERRGLLAAPLVFATSEGELDALLHAVPAPA